MLVAQPKWFKRRKYGGWGVDIETWQGGAYIAAMILSLIILVLICSYYLKNTETTLILTGIWFAFFIIDLSDIIWKLKKDEREMIHEAIAERNAAWGIMTILVIGLFVELLYNALQHKFSADSFIITALVAGVLIKSLTNYKLEKED